ncbi:MAG TPA: large conductance mechanosensitive channel protein MscL [Candidatus Magasanikbacteria bacterium]|nr:MAG: mechanosensitive ion channel protein MscL [Candidatus Magasanikbacteria bacterium RIFCSPLOWO2_02_FULL_47_16]OGH79760.1 MAG: mechanosensitive ion channel protein MscL [Candidatus Magasanikbacteria bacterium RIFCSPHIGHO2_02_FULL_48_18]OGH82547.1 MAG: mechanosensitive ion channel protein MscL [Candidatus Magasanikbacteria bacterium RIFCSPLOWO2_12_FULL_47_9b]HAZ28154.1 large conductance mechanosensitive channel protein MscL [Candidatus Magasanikbacteria bacterium]
MVVKEFLQFIKEYKIISLAIAFVMGSASTSLVNSLVKDVLMPILNPILSTQSWKEIALHVGPIRIPYGSFLAELFNFSILALIVFIVAKKILKEEVVKKK